MGSRQRRQVRKGARAHLVRGKLAEGLIGNDIDQEGAEALATRKTIDIITGNMVIGIELKVQQGLKDRLRLHLLGGVVAGIPTNIGLERNIIEVVL